VKAGYKVSTSAAVALSAGVAKTALMVLTPAQFGGDLLSATVSFDGVTATAVPVLCELVTSTNATNSTPGTANTLETVVQAYGRTITPGFTAFSASTSEPTVLTVLERFLLTPNGGLYPHDIPFPTTPDWAVSAGIGFRLTAPAAVNARLSMGFERC